MQTFRNTASSKLCSISLIASVTVAWNSRITQWTKGIWITKNIGSMFIWAKARRLWNASKQIHQHMLSVNKTHFILGKTTTIPLNYSASVKRRVSSTLRSRRYFFLVAWDIDGWRRSHVNETRSAERKSTVYFKIGILRKDLWSQGKFQVIIVKSLGALFSPKTRNIRYFFADSSLLKVCDCFHLWNVIPGCGWSKNLEWPWKRICNKAWHDF